MLNNHTYLSAEGGPPMSSIPPHIQPRPTRWKLAVTLLVICLITQLLAGCAMGSKSESTAKKEDASSSPIQYQIHAKWNEQTRTLQAQAVVKIRNVFNRNLNELVFHWFADSYRKPETMSIQYKQRNEEIRKQSPQEGHNMEDRFFGGVTTKKITTLDGKPLEFKHANQSMTVNLNQSLAPMDTISLRILYDIQIPYGAQRLSYTENYVGGTYWTPQLAVFDSIRGGWNRVPNNPRYKSDFFYTADYDVSLNMPAAWNVAMTGTMMDQRVENERKIVHTKVQNARQFGFYASPNYIETKAELPGGGLLSVFTFEQPNQGQMQKYTAALQNVIGFYSDKIGVLPTKHWKFVEAPFPEMTDSLNEVILFNQLGAVGSEQGVLSQDVLRSIAKQWFSLAIGHNSLTEGFLEEGLSEFAAHYYRHEQEGAPWPMTLWNGNYPNLSATSSWRDPSGEALALPSEQWPAVLFQKQVTTPAYHVGQYSELLYRVKGGALMVQWVQQTGTEALDIVWHKYFQRYNGRMATIDGYTNLIGSTLGDVRKTSMQELLSMTNPKPVA